MGITILETRLPDKVEAGVLCYPSRWSTTRQLGANGRYSHNQNWTRPVGRWEIAGGRQSLSWGAVRAIKYLHLNCRGSAFGFLFRDPSDYRADEGEGEVVDVGGTLYLAKNYTVGAYTYQRVCKRIIAGSYTIPSGASLDTATGIVTGATAGAPATFHFLKTVCFDSDELPERVHILKGNDADQIELETIGLFEVLED